MFGPLGIVDLNGFASLPAQRFDPSAGPTSFAYDGIIIPMILEAGTTATIAVPESARDTMLILDTLSPDPLPQGHPTLSDGIPALQLVACSDMDTPFQVAVIPSGPQCAPLDIIVSTNPETLRAYLPFGTGNSTCP